MHHAPRTRLALRNLQELEQDGLRGAGAVREVQVVVPETAVHKALAVVHLPGCGAWWGVVGVRCGVVCAASGVTRWMCCTRMTRSVKV